MTNKISFLILLFSFLLMSCQISKINIKKIDLEYIELYQKIDLKEYNAKILPSYYEIVENDVMYKYPLNKDQWNSILLKIENIDYKNMNQYITTTNDSTSKGRLMVKDLKSVIKIKDSKGIYTTKMISQNDQLNELLSLYKELESFLPVR